MSKLTDLVTTLETKVKAEDATIISGIKSEVTSLEAKVSGNKILATIFGFIGFVAGIVVSRIV